MAVATSPTISQVAAIIKTLKTDTDLGKFHKAKTAKNKKAVKLNTGNICGCCGKQIKMSNVKTAQSLYAIGVRDSYVKVKDTKDLTSQTSKA